jgi:hypothetical protein
MFVTFGLQSLTIIGLLQLIHRRLRFIVRSGLAYPRRARSSPYGVTLPKTVALPEPAGAPAAPDRRPPRVSPCEAPGQKYPRSAPLI